MIHGHPWTPAGGNVTCFYGIGERLAWRFALLWRLMVGFASKRLNIMIIVMFFLKVDVTVCSAAAVRWELVIEEVEQHCLRCLYSLADMYP